MNTFCISCIMGYFCGSLLEVSMCRHVKPVVSSISLWFREVIIISTIVKDVSIDSQMSPSMVVESKKKLYQYLVNPIVRIFVGYI